MSAVMVEPYHVQQMPHRKPVGASQHPPTTIQSHSRTPSAASSIIHSSTGQPLATGYPQGPYSADVASQRAMGGYIQPARRTLSNATTSTNSTSGSGSNKGAPIIAPALQRTGSNRSGASFPAANSYVALMRKQKATVWCDRAQLEDPRLVAQRRAAKQRAAAEMAGSVHSVRLLQSSAAGMRSKIRHHGAQKASIYQPANLSGSGVPMRLSASEVDEGDSEDVGETGSLGTGSNVRAASGHHQRTGSGRSSIGSGRRLTYNPPGQGRLSNASTPTSGNASPSDGKSVDETPVPADYAGYRPTDYFDASKGVPHRTATTGSGSSGERENSFGGLGQIPQKTSASREEDKTTDELRRRGSVDDRTMTLSGVRLFVANPDLDD